MKSPLIILFLLSVTCEVCFAQLSKFYPKPTGNQIVEYSQFTLSYNEEHEQAEWVVYHLKKFEVTG